MWWLPVAAMFLGPVQNGNGQGSTTPRTRTKRKPALELQSAPGAAPADPQLLEALAVTATSLHHQQVRS